MPLELLLEKVRYVAIEHCSHLVVDVKLELARFLYIHAQVQACDCVHEFCVLHRIPRARVKECGLALALLLDHVLLKDRQDVPAVVQDTLLVRLLAHELD